MSREELRLFVNALEHSLSLRKELSNLDNLDNLISIAKKYGFNINKTDLKQDKKINSFLDWFEKSKIYPLRKDLE